MRKRSANDKEEDEEERVADRKARKKAKKEKKSKKSKKKGTKDDDDADIENDAKSGNNNTNNNKKKSPSSSDDLSKVEGLPPAFYNEKNDDDDDEKHSKDKTNNADEEEAFVADAEKDATQTKTEGDGNGDDKEEQADEEGGLPGKKKRKRKRKRKNKDGEDGDDDEQQLEPKEKPSSLVDDTIFVEGIPFDCDITKVRNFFETQHSDITDIVDVRLPTWQDSGRLRGFGHIKFGSLDSYDKALALNGKYLGKRYLTIQPANKTMQSGNRSGRSIEDPALVEKPPKDCCTIYVNNLPYDATEKDISAAFQKHTPSIRIVETVENAINKKSNNEENDPDFGGVRIAKNSITRQSKGFAYIDFVSHKDCQKLMTAAVTKNVIVGGRIVRLDYDTGRIKGSFRR